MDTTYSITEKESPDKIDNNRHETFLIEGKRDDFLVINTGRETSWYKVDYSSIPDSHPLAIRVENQSKWYRLKFNLPFLIFLGFLFQSFAIDSFRNGIGIAEVTQFLILVIFVYLTMYGMAVFFFAMEQDMKLWHDFPLLGDVATHKLQEIRKGIDTDPDFIPVYHHIITVTRYKNRSGIELTSFDGYRIRRSRMVKAGRATTGYWLHLCTNGDESIIMPHKELGGHERELIYSAVNFSLQALGRSVADEGQIGYAFLRGIATGPEVLIDPSPVELRLLKSKDKFLHSLKRSEINREIPIPEEYLSS